MKFAVAVLLGLVSAVKINQMQPSHNCATDDGGQGGPGGPPSAAPTAADMVAMCDTDASGGCSLPEVTDMLVGMGAS
jgi:hypothetical protein